ncbi:HalOD1 output domain-containing protein [Natronolimnobius baerhuensis]|uniref:Halobacterial output domain-containing protein n=1 Tax=Natronolimnobius baerhuensis TaxID=253108 RepID=A0A202E6C8_9EURY|nr:HalOD1 output domain-containing protein [Natronolimnobius baerhuensis]OVE83836.1 hypothetical protein B2G88_15575 [Natronolimnobius baerhuensis]
MESALTQTGSTGTAGTLVRYDIADEQSVTEAVIDAVATATGTDPIELPPLYDSIDPDALNTLFDRQREGAGLEMAFFYADYHIAIEGGDRIIVSATE